MRLVVSFPLRDDGSIDDGVASALTSHLEGGYVQGIDVVTESDPDRFIVRDIHTSDTGHIRLLNDT